MQAAFFVLLLGSFTGSFMSSRAAAEEGAPASTSKTGFKDETTLGASIVSGNTNSESYNGKELAEYDWDLDLLRLTGRYLQTKANGTVSALAWDSSLRYERTLTPLFSLFAAYGLDSDVFAGYVQKNNADVGVKYFLIKSDETVWSAELGYRYSVTHYPTALADNASSSARAFTEAVENFSKTTSGKLTVEYVQTLVSSFNSSVPGYATDQDYYVTIEPSLNLMLNQTLSLNLGYLIKYVNYLPQGSTATKYLDTVFTTSLVAKF